MSSTTQMANFSWNKFSFFVAQAGLELMAVFMFHSPGCWDYRGGTPTFTAEFKTKGGMRPPAIASGQHGSFLTPSNSQPLLRGLLGLTPSTL